MEMKAIFCDECDAFLCWIDSDARVTISLCQSCKILEDADGA